MKKLFAFLLLALITTGNAYASSVNVWGERFSLGTIDGFYNSLPGVTSTIISGALETNSLAGVNLLWAVQPADAYTGAEIGKMASFLSGGGRIAFMGEHGGFAPNENARITAAIAALGGHISINLDFPDANFRDASIADGQILAHALTTGVDIYNYACFASLNISGPAQALMVGEENPSQIMMAYENIGAGSIFLITDQNVWDNVYSSSNDNDIMFKNLLLGNTGAPPVATPEPGTMLLMGIGATGIAFMRRRKASKAA